VGALLREWKQDRVVVTVSHDPELVKEADEVILVEQGRVAACGPFEELRASSAALRNTLRIK
jgi:ABC-type bacteriocin/lantibiotic exporter with double-glycine peptidase domain